MILLPELLSDTWLQLLSSEFNQPYMNRLNHFLNTQTEMIYPKPESIFQAFTLCPFETVKVVIIGQDPYPTPGHAHGLAFSVLPEVYPLPKSLQNILVELKNDQQIEAQNGYLIHWAQQGVLLLNSVLTVNAHQPRSHAQQGWEIFTDKVIQLLNHSFSPLVFVLWGKDAQQKAKWINLNKHQIIAAPHPSPLSAYRGFFGSRPFSKINTYLQSYSLTPIDWRIF
ncbi:MAG: hypothetical protein RL637_603 [Pseudomonadota bacterium]|jgi:uracil-DNA glycosylase